MEITEEQLKAFLESDVGKSIVEQNTQAAVAATTAKYDEKLKALNEEKERLLVEKMSEEERTQHELKKYREQIAEQERIINQKALESHATKLIAQYGLPPESIELIASDDATTLTKRATLLSRLMNSSARQQQQQSSFSSSFNQATNEKNPWSKEHWNLTNQGITLRDHPEKARQMAAQYGFEY